jgi:signal transduction histidine kinase
MDILAGPGEADAHLAGILAMVARAVGARRAALVVDVPTRAVTVAIGADEADEAGRPLGAWLDAHAPRSAARRAASPAAPIRVVRAGRDGAPGRGDADAATTGVFFAVPVSGAGGVHLGVELRPGVTAAAVTARLPLSTYRHVLAALALASSRAEDERALAELRSRDAERAGFMSMVAHELRTPLTGIGAGSLGLKVEPFSLAEACTHVLESLEPLAARAEIRLVRALPPRLRPATGDRRRVEQILTNLVANAIKFTPRGGLVELEASTGPAASLVVVRDDGPGIAIEDRARIFEPFVRVEGDARIAGTGLGLPIARDLARAMHGELSAASVLGVGSSFVLVLPGSAGLDGGSVAAALAIALEKEELALEEQAVLAALRRPARSAVRLARHGTNEAPRPGPESASNGSAA